jgi:hypothetical protein
MRSHRLVSRLEERGKEREANLSLIKWQGMRPQSVDHNLLLHLLRENKLNHREIAKRVGCSSERVRQLELDLLHRTGHEAQRERRQRKLQEILDRNEFVKAARRQGLNVEPKNALRDWYKTKLYVNGKLCLLRRAEENVGHKGWYTVIRKPLRRADICVMELSQGRFLIIPMEKMPKSTTTVSLDDSDSQKRAGKWQYRWRKYLNNWAAFLIQNKRGPSDLPPTGKERRGSRNR